MKTTPPTLIDLLRLRAEEQPHTPAFTHLVDGDHDARTWTWAELDERASKVAGALQRRGIARGERVLLLHPQGLDYLAALFGCMMAGVLAVPLQPPGRHRAKLAAPKLEAIVRDGGVALAATTTSLLDDMRAVVAEAPALVGLGWLTSEDCDGARGEAVPVQPSDVAYLQYTSGSTSTPKGVVITHANLTTNLDDFDADYGHDSRSVMVSWLPTFHDLGLVYGVFMPLYGGFHGVLLDPLHFLRRPMRWLEALARYGGTHSPAPNFAFDLVAARSTPEARAALDLSGWRVALNGAEPIRHDTEARFVEAFAASGVTWRTISHAYGMSETTAVISKEPVGTEPVFVCVDGAAMEQHRVVEVPRGTDGARMIAGCGQTVHDTVVRIVDPDTTAVRADLEVGEIWVGGPTVAGGYWRSPEATAESFAARTTSGEGPFLRTGDLGFVARGQVFVTGRLKDMLIVRGENHYPQDLEWTVQEASAALRPSCVAAFQRGDDERVVVVAEVYPDKVGDPDALFGLIREGISSHGLSVGDIALIAPRAIFKTSTGKIMRRRTRQALDDGTLPLVARWVAIDEVDPAPQAGGDGLLQQLRDAAEVERAGLLVDAVLERAGGLLGLPGHALDPELPLRELGFDSVQAVELADLLSGDLGTELPTTVLFDHPTATALADWLMGELELDGAAAPAAAAASDDDGDDLEALLARELEDL